MEKIRLGLIGCGIMMKHHAVNVNKEERLEIVAICDTSRERAEAVAEVLNSPKIFDDYTKMVDHVYAVLIGLPHDLHYECGMFSARNKKHILMEKPLCNTEEECIRLIETCEEESGNLLCAYPVRYWPAVVKMKEMIDSGAYGKVMQMSIWTEQLTKFSETSWSATSRLGGGQFFSHGCHYVDILLWFLGNPISGTHFGTKIGTPWMLKEGTSTAIFKFESGALGYHGATWGARGTKLGSNFQIMTEKGLIEYDVLDGVIRVYDSKVEHIPGEYDREKLKGSATATDHKEVWNRKRDGGDAVTQFEIAHFVDCVLTGQKPLTDGRSAMKSLQVIWRMYDAEKTNTIADLRGLGLDE